MIQDAAGKVKDNAFLSVSEDTGGNYRCRLADRDGNALTGEWTTTKEDFARRLNENMKAVYGDGLTFRAFPDGPENIKNLGNAASFFHNRDVSGTDIAAQTVAQQEQLQEAARKALAARTIRQDEEDNKKLQTEKEAGHDNRQKDKLSPEDARTVSARRSAAAKLAITVLVGGAVVNAAVSRRDVEKLNTLPAGKQEAMIQKMLPQLDFKNAAHETVKHIATAITTAVKNPGMEVSIPRPEIYASAMVSQTEASSQLMRGTAASAYENDTNRSQGAEVSQSVGRGI